MTKVNMTEQLITVDQIGELRPWTRVNLNVKPPEVDSIGALYEPWWEVNPKPGCYTSVLYSQQFNPKNRQNIFAGSMEYLECFKKTSLRNRLLAEIRRMRKMINDPEYVSKWKNMVHHHEELHQIQSIRLDVVSVRSYAIALEGRWYEKEPFPKTKVIKDDEQVLNVLSEAQVRAIQYGEAGRDPSLTRDILLMSLVGVVPMTDEYNLNRLISGLRQRKSDDINIHLLADMVATTGDIDLINTLKRTRGKKVSRLAKAIFADVQRILDDEKIKFDQARLLQLDGKIMGLTKKIKTEIEELTD